MDEDRLKTTEYEANGPPALVIAGTFSMTAFAVALVSGGLAGGSAVAVISDALAAMLLCYPLGYVVGKLGNRVISERIASFKKERAVPDLRSAIEAIDREAGVLTVDPIGEEGALAVPAGGGDGGVVTGGENALDVGAQEVTSQR